MNTERINAEIAEFEKKESVSLNDFMEQAKKENPPYSYFGCLFRSHDGCSCTRFRFE